jgi:hypothetical protein
MLKVQKGSDSRIGAGARWASYELQARSPSGCQSIATRRVRPNN